MFEVTDAKREQLIGAIGFIGASGAGKTLSMLKVAKGFMDKKYPDLDDASKWQKVGVIDTEHERSKIYAGTSSFGVEIGAFKHLNFEAPYSVERLDQAVRFLKEQHKVEIIIIDSTSHFWEGEGGILDLQQKFGGSFQAWRDVNPHYEHFISLVTGDKHKIDTLNGIRAKQHYEVSQNEVGKLQVEKMGLKPVQRDSLEYEFHIAFNIGMDHVATALKDNSGMFDGVPKQIELDTGEKMYEWLKSGVDIIAEEKKERDDLLDKIYAFQESKVEGMAEHATEAIKATNDKFTDISKLSTDVLKTIHNRFEKKEKELKTADESVLKGLQETAKGFKIKGYTKMNKEELEEAIKQAQTQG